MAATSNSSAPSPSALPPFLRQTRAEVKAKFEDLEWEQRNRTLQASQSPTDSPSRWSRLSGDAVKSRNRYFNVEPYASNRIKLQVGDGGNDYINASPIRLGKRRYIATQGPKETNVNHFYRMLAQEAPAGQAMVVVMLTMTHEAGREKCFQYYPLAAEESPLMIPEEDGFAGEVHLEGVEEDERTRSQIRRLRARTRRRDGKSDEGGGENEVEMETEITHLLYSAWPDFLVPEGEDRAALLNLVQLSADLNHETPSSSSSDLPNGTDPKSPPPRIIHCSAGVGRSGTFIALDHLLHLLHTGDFESLPPDRDPVAETVDELRKQRMMMVQGEPQFHFLYEVLAEVMQRRLRGEGEGAKTEVGKVE